MKKLFLIFMTLILTLTSLTSCSWLDTPANAKRIGSGLIKQENNTLFVEIDGIRYSPSYIYTNGPSSKETTSPSVGMEVTLFTLYNKPTIEFISGNLSTEYLEQYFTINATIPYILAGTMILCVFVILFLDSSPKRKTVIAD